MTVVDWAHATQGNASADAAMTYLLFALKDQEVADLYLNTFCKKERYSKAVCTAVAPNRSGSTAFKR